MHEDLTRVALRASRQRLKVQIFLGASMATAGTIVFEGKIAVDIILAEDGKYYVDTTTTMDGEVVSVWTDGPFETEAKARECLQWGYAVPMLEREAKG